MIFTSKLCCDFSSVIHNELGTHRAPPSHLYDSADNHRAPSKWTMWKCARKSGGSRPVSIGAQRDGKDEIYFSLSRNFSQPYMYTIA